MRGVALAAVLLAVGCTSTNTSKPDQEPPNKPEVASAKQAPKPEPKPGPGADAAAPKPEPKIAAPRLPAGRRPFVFFRESGQEWAEVWRFDDTGSPQTLDLEVVYPGGGSMGIGTRSPVLSWDGRWLAYIDDGDLVVAPLRDESKAYREPSERDGGEQELHICGFSADGRSLLFHRGEVSAMYDPVALPKGEVRGFSLLSLPDFKELRLKDVPGFDAWQHDGRGILWVNDSNETVNLESVSLTPLRRELLIESKHSIRQPSFNGTHFAYVRSAPGKSTVVFSSLDGASSVDLTPTEGFAQQQWPRPSPDNLRVAYLRRKQPRASNGELHVVEVKRPKLPHIVYEDDGGYSNFAWIDNETLILFDGAALVKVSARGGEPEVLTKETVGFVAAGET